MQITGKIIYKSAIGEVAAGYRKQDIWLDCSNTRDGQRYENYCKLQFSNKNIAKLDGIGIGSIVRVDFGIKGRKYRTAADIEDVFVTLDAYAIETIRRNETYTDVDKIFEKEPDTAGSPQVDGWKSSTGKKYVKK